MNKLKIVSTPLAAVFAASLLAGCSFSKSSESSSDSSKGLFTLTSSSLESSSDSSETKGEKYEKDVADYTAEFVVSSSGDLDSFRDKLGKLAERNGITDWENDHATYVGIGRGLHKAKLGKPQVSAFTESLGGEDPMKRKAIEEGLSK
ncbi:putative lipoprotein [Methylococcus sp. EFPC2]|uniref:putative lipoprotein n=1 Tax=Methylococcus sp. EFPC2 TaxID=2812648 RepID=UPI0019674C37|nr:putative lipoprotein [Methylococcus sp. EFPC2]QSA96317.1 putative lipoprotein [Methylococcus sp. EFPC2]